MQRLYARVGKEVTQLYDPDDGISFDTSTRFARTGADVACTQGHLSALRSNLSTSLHWSSDVPRSTFSLWEPDRADDHTAYYRYRPLDRHPAHLAGLRSLYLPFLPNALRGSEFRSIKKA